MHVWFYLGSMVTHNHCLHGIRFARQVSMYQKGFLLHVYTRIPPKNKQTKP